MANNQLKKTPYSGCCAILTTKHAKSLAIAPAFWENLQISMLEYTLNTDLLGTFSGEIEREGSMLDCARRKCEMGMETLGDKVEYGLASEGSFGHHPLIPFLPCHCEVLYFIDRKRGFHLHEFTMTENTNYQMKTIESLEALHAFANSAKFPDHGIIVRANIWNDKSVIYKGIRNSEVLAAAFESSIKHSDDGKAWVEADMRAHMNPTRMSVIAEIAQKLSIRLATLCPNCEAPGWGKVRVEQGLKCRICSHETEMVKSEIFGCTKCDYTEQKNRPDGIETAEPQNCQFCNP